MQRPRLIYGLAALLALSLPALTAQAQDAASAEALFDKGLADMKAGNYEKGCPALAESQRLDPRPGTLFTLAECEAKADKIATATAHYAEYLRAYEAMPATVRWKHTPRAKIAEAQKAALEKQVPTLTMTLPADAPAGIEVTRDGVVIGAASLGVALPMDPGEHVILAQLGAKQSEQRVTLARGEQKTVELQTTSLLPDPEPIVKLLPPRPVAPPPDAPASNGRRTAGFVVGGIGLAGIAVGAIAGGIAIGKKGTVDANCSETTCQPDGLRAVESGRTVSTVSTVGFAMGLAALAGGAVLVLTAPRGGKTKTGKAETQIGILAAGPDGAFVGARGAF